jgi:hypothetical protein
MRPLFTVHGGEYLVGSYIENHYKHANVWVPSRDTGVDLLVSNSQSSSAISLQVKFSKDYLVTHMGAEFQKNLRACGWWTLDRKKLRLSPANLWVFVLVGYEKRSTDFVIIPPKRLLQFLNRVHGTRNEIIQSYIWVTEQNACWETRGLGRTDQLQVANGTYSNPRRSLKKYLNAWEPIERLDN